MTEYFTKFFKNNNKTNNLQFTKYYKHEKSTKNESKAKQSQKKAHKSNSNGWATTNENNKQCAWVLKCDNDWTFYIFTNFTMSENYTKLLNSQLY